MPSRCSAGITWSFERRVLIVDERMRSLGNRLQILAQKGRGRLAHTFEVVGESHLEELVHVGRNDAHVAQSLEQRHVRAQRLGEHTPVELEHRPLAAEQRHRQVRSGGQHLDG